MFDNNEHRDLVFLDVRDTIIISLVELLYNGSATISVRNRAEFFEALETFQIDGQPRQQQMQPRQQQVQPSQQQMQPRQQQMQPLFAVPTVRHNANRTIDENQALKPSHIKQARSMSVSARNTTPQKMKPSQSAGNLAGKEDLREIAKANKNFARPRSKSAAEPQKQTSKDKEEKNDSSPIRKPRGRPPGSGKQALTPTPSKKKKDGIACPECGAIFKTGELVTEHFNRAHNLKRVRRPTKLFESEKKIRPT